MIMLLTKLASNIIIFIFLRWVNGNILYCVVFKQLPQIGKGCIIADKEDLFRLVGNNHEGVVWFLVKNKVLNVCPIDWIEGRIRPEQENKI